MTANPIDMQIIGPLGRAQVLREVASGLGLPGEDIVPSEDALKRQQQQAQALAQQQGIPGHAMGPQQSGPGGGSSGSSGGPPQASPQAPPQARGPTGAPGNAPPQMGPGAAAPRTNLVNQTGPGSVTAGG
jgi:hypothetical protein